MTEATVIILAAAIIYWFLILRPGRLDFWRVAAKHPDAAYEHLKSDPCWILFEDQVPDNYRTLYPKPEWVGPFRLIVPKLGYKTVHILGKNQNLEKSQGTFLSRMTGQNH